MHALMQIIPALLPRPLGENEYEHNIEAIRRGKRLPNNDSQVGITSVMDRNYNIYST